MQIPLLSSRVRACSLVICISLAHVRLEVTIPSGIKSFLQSWVINTLAVLVAALIIPGIHYDTTVALLIATLLLGVLNTFLRPLILLLSLPLVLLTLGLFQLIINALLFYLVGSAVPGFHVNGFWSAFWGALIISLVTLALNLLTGTGRSRVTFHRGKPPTRPRGPGDDDGPVIDV